MKNTKTTALVTLTAAACFLCAGAMAGTFKTITIDDDYSDWVGVPVLDSDPADNPGSVDIADTQMANDNDYLYIRNTFHGGLSLPTYIALDVDQNTATGYDIFGLGLVGSEAGWQNDFPFTQSAGVFKGAHCAGNVRLIANLEGHVAAVAGYRTEYVGVPH